MGFGASVIALLKKSKIKRNLYFEIKERVMEERIEHMGTTKRKQKVKVYGFDETKNSRNLLMEILRDRMDNHKSRFIANIIYEELCTLEVKKNGRIEHADNAHDDQIFSYLMALYVWYYGKNLMENFGMDKRMIHTDADEDVEVDPLGEDYSYTDIVSEMEVDTEQVKQQMQYIKSDKSMLYEQFLESERAKDKEALDNLLRTKLGRQAYAEKYHIDESDLNTSALFKIPDEEFNLYSEPAKKSEMQRQFDSMGIPR